MLVNRDGRGAVEGFYPTSVLSDVYRDACLWKRDKDSKSVLCCMCSDTVVHLQQQAFCLMSFLAFIYLMA